MMTEEQEAKLRSRTLSDEKFREALIDDPKSTAARLQISLDPEECALIQEQADIIREQATAMKATADKAGEGKFLGFFFTKHGKNKSGKPGTVPPER